MLLKQLDWFGLFKENTASYLKQSNQLWNMKQEQLCYSKGQNASQIKTLVTMKL